MLKTAPHAHLIPAIREWLLENYDRVFLHLNVHQLNDAYLTQFGVDGLLTLDVSPWSVRNFNVTVDSLTFDCRFQGKPHHVSIDPRAVINVLGFNRDNPQEQSQFPLPEWDFEVEPEQRPEAPVKRPHLSLVK